MITWTTAGAVERPRMVQVRVQRAYPGRVRAGAPVPTRSMSEAEVIENLRFFTRGMRGPRSLPCERLVLSGVGVATRPDTPAVLAEARALGMAHVVLHVGPEDLDGFAPAPLAGAVDLVVVPVQPGHTGGLLAGAAALRRCQDAGLKVVANTQLSALALRDLVPAARLMAGARPDAVGFTYPFPISGNTSVHVPPLAATLAALEQAAALLQAAGVEVSIKGLPACYLGALAPLAGRTANRWYVDADHQLGEALLFFPGVVSFTKTDECRFCARDGTCDGFFATYLRRSGFPPLKAL